VLYIKTKLNDQVEIKIDLYEDEIFTTCPVCGKEHQVDAKKIEDWVGTSVSCGSYECNNQMTEEVIRFNSKGITG
jgi:translation initiation factor 2 beta subunit (eIF-2beta)/eIF-5